jgi:hypothetical protein
MRTSEMDIRTVSEIQIEHEGSFARLDSAFTRRDFVAFDRAVRTT